jgi:hypothetical protein
MTNKEPLDFCRVKKIHENGFGFLQSLYYEEDVFIHFSKIDDPEVKKSLNNMERGKIYLYFLSSLKSGKRRAEKIWLNLKDVPSDYIDEFTNKIASEFNDGKTNPYELAYVAKEMIECGIADEEIIVKILSSVKIMRIPSICKAFVPEGNKNSGKIDEIISDAESRDEFPISARRRIVELLLK